MRRNLAREYHRVRGNQSEDSSQDTPAVALLRAKTAAAAQGAASQVGTNISLALAVQQCRYCLNER